MEDDAGHGWAEPAGDGAVHGSTETIGERIGAHLRMQRNAPIAQLQTAAALVQIHAVNENSFARQSQVGLAKGSIAKGSIAQKSMFPKNTS
jgi:hypothetical protein